MPALGAYKRPFVYALLVHLAVGILLSLNLHLDSRPTPVLQLGEQPEIVQAVAVDESKVEAEMAEIRAAEARRKNKQEAEQKRLQREATAAQRKRKAEEERLAQLKKQREEQARKHKQEAEGLAALEKQRAQEKAELERIQQEARQAEDEKRRLQEEAARRQQLEEEQQRLAAEQARRDEARRAANLQESQRYLAQMQAKVQRNWINPVAGNSGLECVIRVRLSREGKVLLAQVVQGSGNAVFDRSVEAAVLKASPLPLPQDPSVMEGYPELRFKFKPQ